MSALSIDGPMSTSTRPATSDFTPFMRAASPDSALSGVSGPSTTAPRNMPCAAIAFSATASVVERNAGAGPSIAASSATLGAASPERDRKLDRVLHDVALGGEIGRDVHLGVGQQVAARLAGNVEEVRMRQPALGAQAGFRVDHGTQQVLVAEAALDQRRDLSLAREVGRACAGRFRIVGRVDDREARDVEPRLAGEIADARFGPDQRGVEIAGEGAGQRDLQRVKVAGEHDSRHERRQEAGSFDQLLEMRSRQHRCSVSSARPDVNGTPTVGRCQPAPGKSVDVAMQHSRLPAGLQRFSRSPSAYGAGCPPWHRHATSRRSAAAPRSRNRRSPSSAARCRRAFSGTCARARPARPRDAGRSR